MAVRTKIVLVVLLLSAIMSVAGFLAFRAALEPSAESFKLVPHYMGRAAIAVPEVLTLDSGRLQMICRGAPGRTVVTETPHQDYGPVAYEALSIMLPGGGPSSIVEDISLQIGRPAQMVITETGPGQATASLIADLGQGSLRLSRPLDTYGPPERLARFKQEAIQFLSNYTWGHRAAGWDDLHSLSGRVNGNQLCQRADYDLLFTGGQSLRLLAFQGEAPDQAVEARRLAAIDLSSPPTRWSQAARIFQGQWNRAIRGGPRRVAGRPGLEWVTLSRDLRSGQTIFTAVWQPEEYGAEPTLPLLIMNSSLNEAPQALKMWTDTLNATTLAADF